MMSATLEAVPPSEHAGRRGRVVGYEGRRLQAVLAGDPADSPVWLDIGEVRFEGEGWSVEGLNRLLCEVAALARGEGDAVPEAGGTAELIHMWSLY